MVFQAIRLMYHLGFSAFLMNCTFMFYMNHNSLSAVEALLCFDSNFQSKEYTFVYWLFILSFAQS